MRLTTFSFSLTVWFAIITLHLLASSGGALPIAVSVHVMVQCLAYLHLLTLTEAGYRQFKRRICH